MDTRTANPDPAQRWGALAQARVRKRPPVHDGGTPTAGSSKAPARTKEAVMMPIGSDPIIKRSDLPHLLGVHTDTVRRMLKDNKLPGYDVALSRKTCGWKRSTLVAAGVNV